MADSVALSRTRSPNPQSPRPLDFDDFFREQQSSLVTEASRLLGDRARAEEVVQEAFLAAHQNWETVRKYDRPGAWVRRVMVRKVIDQKRHNDRAPAPHLLSFEPTSPAVLVDAETIDWLAPLPQVQARCLLLVDVLGYSAKEAGSLIGVSATAVRTNAYRGRLRLRDCHTNDTRRSVALLLMLFMSRRWSGGHVLRGERPPARRNRQVADVAAAHSLQPGFTLWLQSAALVAGVSVLAVGSTVALGTAEPAMAGAETAQAAQPSRIDTTATPTTRTSVPARQNPTSTTALSTQKTAAPPRTVTTAVSAKVGVTSTIDVAPGASSAPTTSSKGGSLGDGVAVNFPDPSPAAPTTASTATSTPLATTTTTCPSGSTAMTPLLGSQNFLQQTGGTGRVVTRSAKSFAFSSSKETQMRKFIATVTTAAAVAASGCVVAPSNTLTQTLTITSADGFGPTPNVSFTASCTDCTVQPTSATTNASGRATLTITGPRQSFSNVRIESAYDPVTGRGPAGAYKRDLGTGTTSSFALNPSVISFINSWGAVLWMPALPVGGTCASVLAGDPGVACDTVVFDRITPNTLADFSAPQHQACSSRPNGTVIGGVTVQFDCRPDLGFADRWFFHRGDASTFGVNGTGAYSDADVVVPDGSAEIIIETGQVTGRIRVGNGPVQNIPG